VNPAWKRRLPWIALGLSVALNVFLGAFLGGEIWNRPRRGEPGEVARALDLTPEQREAFQRFRKTAREENMRFREEVRPVLRRSWSELAKQNPDETVLAQSYDDALARRREMHRATLRELRGFLQTLTPEQRERFVALESERQQRGFPGRRP
jgi:Spy/CpxP family protein refolding chaperone